MFFILLSHKIFLMMKLKTNLSHFFTIVLISVLFLTRPLTVIAQNDSITKQKSDFWQKVQFGGGLGLNIGGNYTNILIAPGAIYPLNNYVSVGLGVQYSYANQKNDYQSHIYGANLLTFINPIPQAQLSVEMEQLRINNTFSQFNPVVKENFWNTALFLGAGYRSQNVTIGFRYNILYREANNVYGQAWMPFVRAYF